MRSIYTVTRPAMPCFGDFLGIKTSGPWNSRFHSHPIGRILFKGSLGVGDLNAKEKPSAEIFSRSKANYPGLIWVRCKQEGGGRGRAPKYGAGQGRGGAGPLKEDVI